MARAVLAFEPARELLHLDPGLVAGRVHLGRGRREQNVAPAASAMRRVAGLVSRVREEVGVLVELSRVDEEADDDRVALGACRRDQRLVARVQRAHRRHEADDPASPERR